MASRIDPLVVLAVLGVLALAGVVALPGRPDRPEGDELAWAERSGDESTIHWTGTLCTPDGTPFVDAAVLRLTTEPDPRRRDPDPIDRRFHIDRWGGFALDVPPGRYRARIPTLTGQVDLGVVQLSGAVKRQDLTLPNSVLVVNIEPSSSADAKLATKVAGALELRCGLDPARKPDLRREARRNVFFDLTPGAYDVRLPEGARVGGAPSSGYKILVASDCRMRDVSIEVEATR